MANTKYKTAKVIEAEAKSSGMTFVTYPYDFNNGKQRFITAEKREEIVERQQQMFNVDFDKFLEELYFEEYPEDIIESFENMYYNKPTFSLAIISGANIDLNKVASFLKANKNNVAAQKTIADQFNGQLNVAAFKGMARDYYSTLISIQEGYEGKASMSFMGNINNLLDKSVFCTDSSKASNNDPVQNAYSNLIEKMKTDLKQIRGNRTLQNALETVKNTNKNILGYTNTHPSKNYSM